MRPKKKKIITKQENEISKAIAVETDKGTIQADKIILATGGKSYPLTGSTGDGYKIAEQLGHTIKEIKPSLVPLETYSKDICKALQGLSLKNVEIKFIDIETRKKYI